MRAYKTYIWLRIYLALYFFLSKLAVKFAELELIKMIFAHI